jgi:glyoxylase-like metal-dependent hydrolase (beta-lactamase superfamily II)
MQADLQQSPAHQTPGTNQSPGQRGSGRQRRTPQAAEPLNPIGAKNTDSVLSAHTEGPVLHDYTVEGPAPGTLGFRWAMGSTIPAKNRDPRVQVMAYNEDTYAMRQNICIDWRGPFTYLLTGNKSALLIDTGATADAQHYPLRATVEGILARLAKVRRTAMLPLTIALCSPEYKAQNGGSEQFRGRANTTTLARTSDSLDLGGRVVDVIATPGAHRDGLSFYDRYTQLLFTGDLLFPGKVMIANARDYIASLEKLAAWKEQHPVKWVVGAHVDMQVVPGHAYQRFAMFKPMERSLQLEPTAIDDALTAAKQVQTQGEGTALARNEFWLINNAGIDTTPTNMRDFPNIQTPRFF